jgi:hypothetical protein
MKNYENFKQQLWRGLFFAMLTFLSTARDTLANSASPPWVMNSVNMLPAAGSPFGSRASCEQVRNLKQELNINTISFRKNLVVSTFDSPDPFNPGNDGTSDREIEQQFLIDKKLGVKSYFELGLRVQTDQALENKANANPDLDGCEDKWDPWHGTILFDSPEKYSAFFDKYGAQLLHYADLAKKSGNVSVFSIGHELDSLAGTTPLLTKTDGDSFANELNMYMMGMGDDATKWAKTEVSDLLRFNDAVAKNSMPVNVTVSADQRSSWTKALDFLKEKSNTLRAEITKDPREELEEWAKTGGKHCLAQIRWPGTACISDNAKAYLAQLENTRRSFINARWEKLIDQLHAKFATMPQSKRPLLTYTAGDPSRMGPFASKLDILSVSPYWSLGNMSRARQRPKIDNDISVDHLEQGWERAVSGLDQMVKTPGPYHGKQVIFSEIGFTPRQHSTQNPYQWHGCQVLVTKWGLLDKPVPAMHRPISEMERENAIGALQKVIQEEKPDSWEIQKKYPWIAGVNMYDTFTNPKSTSDEYCVDCRKNGLSAGYENSIKNLFESVSSVTNKYSGPDPCLPPKPKPKPKPIIANTLRPVTLSDIELGGPGSLVPFLKWPDSTSHSSTNPFGLPFFEDRSSDADEPASQEDTKSYPQIPEVPEGRGI